MFCTVSNPPFEEANATEGRQEDSLKPGKGAHKYCFDVGVKCSRRAEVIHKVLWLSKRICDL